MISRKSLLITIALTFFINNLSMAEMCARLKRVSGGENHTLALMDDNTLWACGWNYHKVLGLGSSVPYSYSLDQVLGEDGEGVLQNVATFDAGWYHSLAADTNGTLWAWGTEKESSSSVNYGLLGNGPNEVNWDVPRKVHGIDDEGCLSDTVDIVYVSAGRSGTHSLVVDSDGYVYGFGYNAFGQCGDGTSGSGNNTRQTPVCVLDDDPNTNDPNTVGIYLGDIATIIQADAELVNINETEY